MAPGRPIPFWYYNFSCIEISLDVDDKSHGSPCPALSHLTSGTCLPFSQDVMYIPPRFRSHCILHNLTPDCLHHLLGPVSAITLRNLRSISKQKLHSKTKFTFLQSLSYRPTGPQVWNSILKSTRDSLSAIAFQSNLRNE